MPALCTIYYLSPAHSCYYEVVCYTPMEKGYFQPTNSLRGVKQGQLVNQAQ